MSGGYTVTLTFPAEGQYDAASFVSFWADGRADNTFAQFSRAHLVASGAGNPRGSDFTGGSDSFAHSAMNPGEDPPIVVSEDGQSLTYTSYYGLTGDPNMGMEPVVSPDELLDIYILD